MIKVENLTKLNPRPEGQLLLSFAAYEDSFYLNSKGIDDYCRRMERRINTAIEQYNIFKDMVIDKAKISAELKAKRVIVEFIFALLRDNNEEPDVHRLLAEFKICYEGLASGNKGDEHQIRRLCICLLNLRIDDVAEALCKARLNQPLIVGLQIQEKATQPAVVIDMMERLILLRALTPSAHTLVQQLNMYPLTRIEQAIADYPKLKAGGKVPVSCKNAYIFTRTIQYGPIGNFDTICEDRAYQVLGMSAAKAIEWNQNDPDRVREKMLAHYIK